MKLQKSKRFKSRPHSFRRSGLQHERLEDRSMLTAMLQVIHNSPYAEAAVVDVYANDALLLDDFAFREASPFVEVPSGVDITLDITAADASDNSHPVYSATVNLGSETYVAMAAGDPLGREGQPAFGLAVTDMGREAAATEGNAEFLVVHGSPDAPTVDVVARGVGILVDDISYPEFASDYLSVAPANYTIDITPGDDDAVVASFEADLSGAAGAALVVAASGFLAPADEADPSFGLLAVFADGTSALLPTAAPEPASLQVIHNSPYAEAAVVDVYANDALLLDDFAFRDASPFVEVPSGVDITLDITAADASDNSHPVYTATVNLASETYVAMAAGDPLGREGQPAFGLAVTDMGREAAATEGNAEFLVVHGSPDAPTVDVVARGVGILVDDISYPEFASDYLSVAPANYTIDITPGDDDAVVASFEADLSGAAGAALVVAASGFLAPADEADPSFGLLAVFADGTSALLPTAAPEPASLQVIHNSPYAEAAVVDVYANDALLLDDFAFRDASPFVEVPSGVDITLDITAADAADNSNPVYTATVNLASETYVAMAAGDPLAREGQPAFGLAVTDMGREASTTVGNAEFLVVHGSPDAPTVDVVARGVGILVDDISYPEFAPDYLSVAPANYTIDITPGDDDAVVASFEADLSGAAGAALVVAASGFLAPADETDPSFGLLAVFADGTSALLPAAPLPPIPGDSNGDGVFDQADLVLAFQGGKYDTGDHATFEQGDWNGDGVFDSSDPISAFQAGNFQSPGHPAPATMAVDSLFADDEDTNSLLIG